MNERYALPIALMAWSAAQAQFPGLCPPAAAPSPVTHILEDILPAEGELRAGGDVVFYEDFANGAAGNNGVGEWTTSGPHGNIWRRSTTGPNGAYTSPTSSRIQSATATNGFMMFASDSANTNWSTNPPTIVADPIPFEGSLVSPLLDLSATPYVELVFQQRGRFCCGSVAPYVVEVSTDGGATWPHRYPTMPDLGANTLSGTITTRINIVAAIAANPANVKFRFRHDGSVGVTHYHWQVDDVRVVELYEHDLKLESAALTRFDIETAMTYDSLPYTIFPYSQLRPMGLNMQLLNNGATTQDATANFKVTRNGVQVFENNVMFPSLSAGARTDVFPNADFVPPAETGVYTVTFTAQAPNEDATPADNVRTTTFQVSEAIYARDNGALTGHFEAGNDGNLIVCNAFHVAHAADLYALQVAVRTGSEVGSVLMADIRTGLNDVLDYAMEVELGSDMMSGTNTGNFINLPFYNPVALEAGGDYLACVTTVGQVRLGQSGTSPQQTSFIWYLGGSGLAWYWTANTPMIRMNFGELSVGVDGPVRADLLGQNMPNPADVSTMVEYTVERPGAVSMQVRDISGKLVMEQAMGVQPAGVHRIELHTAQLPQGVYTYTLITADGHSTRRMVVMH